MSSRWAPTTMPTPSAMALAAALGATLASTTPAAAQDAPPTDSPSTDAPSTPTADASTETESRAHADALARELFGGGAHTPTELLRLAGMLDDAAEPLEAAVDDLAHYLAERPSAPERAALEGRARTLRDEAAGLRRRAAALRAEAGGAARTTATITTATTPDTDGRDAVLAATQRRLAASVERDATAELVGVVSLGAGALLGLGGLVTGLLAEDRYDQLDRICGPAGDACPPGSGALIDEGSSLATASTVLSFSALVAATAGTTLLVLGLTDGDPGSSAVTSVSIEGAPGGALVVATGRL